MLLAYYLHNLSPFIWEITPGFGPRWYGFAYVLAFLAGYLVYRWLARRGYSELPPEKVGDFITWAALFGVLLGGRLGSMIFYNWTAWIHDPLMFFRVWEGGMASHGGILGLMLFTLWYCPPPSPFLDQHRRQPLRRRPHWPLLWPARQFHQRRALWPRRAGRRLGRPVSQGTL